MDSEKASTAGSPCLNKKHCGDFCYGECIGLENIVEKIISTNVFILKAKDIVTDVTMRDELKKDILEALEAYATERVREIIDGYNDTLAIKNARAEGYKAGQEDMRERAAVIPGHVWLHGSVGSAQTFCTDIVREIRSLSIEEKHD